MHKNTCDAVIFAQTTQVISSHSAWFILK